MKTYTEDEIAAIFAKIDAMSQIEMAYVWRFHPAGFIYFDSTLPFFNHFNERFKSLGGFTSEISKEIGWERGYYGRIRDI